MSAMESRFAARNRLSAEAFQIERFFGEQVPMCRACKSLDVVENHHRACVECRSCGRIEANENVLMVPKDERVRAEMGL